MVNFLVAAALAAASPQAAPEPAVASSEVQPALFAVGDADTTIYIFGTFHALDGQADWFKSNVRGAFESSSELVLETLVPEGPDRGQLATMPRYRGLMTPSASFLATTRMAINAGRSQGMQVDNGADMVLRHTAEAEGKSVAGLETLESQLNMFTKLPSTPTHEPKPGEAIPETSPMDSLSKAMAEMQTAWKRGDQSVFVRMLGQLDANSPATYRMMFTERNARWADWIRARLQTPGTVFVAVGAGHLAGPGSVQDQLRALGLKAVRVQ